MPCWIIDLFRYNCKDDELKIRNILANHGIHVHQVNEFATVDVRDDKPGAENRVFAAAEEIRAFFGLDDVVISSDTSCHVLKSVCLV